MLKLLVGIAAVCALFAGLFSSVQAATVGPYSQLKLNAVATGSQVASSAVVSSPTPKQVNSFGICVRDSSNRNSDYPKEQVATITPAGTAVTRTKNFAAGTYTYFPCLFADGSWYNVGTPKTFVVGTPNPSSTTLPSSVPTTTSSVPPTTSALPSSTVPTTSTTPTPTGGTAGTGQTIFLDDFNGPTSSLPDSRKWSYQVGGSGWGNNELEYYKSGDPDNSSMDGNGHLRLVVRAENYGGRSYTSARIRTMGKFDFLYGTVEARIKIPAGSGLWPAFWTQGTKGNLGIQDDWPRMGEIDVMEAVNSDKGYSATVHGGPTHWSKYKWSPIPARDNAFHLYVAKWSPGKIAFYVDGALVTTVTKSQTPPGRTWPFDSARQYLLLNVAMGGNYPGTPNGSASLPATMLVDYVKVTQ